MRAAYPAEAEERSSIQAIKAIADKLKGCGFDISGPEPGAGHCFQVIGTPGLRCEVSICGSTAEWEYRPPGDGHCEPACIAVSALHLLGASPADGAVLPPQPSGLTLKAPLAGCWRSAG